MSEKNKPKARVVEANRAQMRLVPTDLESMLPVDHAARAVWAFVDRLDLDPFYDAIRSREGSAGRPATDPQIFLALWLYATLEGVGSAREIARLSQYHLAYQWICGGVSVNPHSLSDFRNAATDHLNDLLTQSVTSLVASGLAEIRRVAQDGMKVRASAGASSFRTRAGLNKLRRVARNQVERLASEIDQEPGAAARRDAAATKQAAERRAARIERALAEMKDAEERKRSNNGKKKSEPRASTTDPNARVMKMPDGGFRPAYNVHFVTDTVSKVILGVEVDNLGTDAHAMVPLAEQIEERYAVRPAEWLADGGCTSLNNIDAMDARGCAIIAPLRQRRSGRDPEQVRPTDTAAVRRWRRRMSRKKAKEIYKQRGATAELVNAQCRGQGLLQFLVRGVEKAKAAVLLHALAHNMRRGWALA
jgi:transposase